MQSYTQFTNSVGKAPTGRYTGAGHVGVRMGVSSVTSVPACPSCSCVSGKLGIGRINCKGKSGSSR